MSSAAKQILEEVRSVRTELSDHRKDTREDVREIWGEIKDIKRCELHIKLRAEKHDAKINRLEEVLSEVCKTDKAMKEHISDGKIHFDRKKLDETWYEYISKKKFLAAILSAVAALVSGAVSYLLGLI